MANTIGPRPPPSTSSVSSSRPAAAAPSTAPAGPTDSFTPAAKSTTSSAATGDWKAYGKSADEIGNMSADDIKGISKDDIMHMSQEQIQAYLKKSDLPADPNARTQDQKDLAYTLALRIGQLGFIQQMMSHAQKSPIVF